jgi:cytidine deaminase
VSPLAARRFEAVIFDMDGVLVDSEAYICRAACQMFKEWGQIVQPADFTPFIGTGENRYLGGVAEKYKLSVDIGADPRCDIATVNA